MQERNPWAPPENNFCPHCGKYPEEIDQPSLTEYMVVGGMAILFAVLMLTGLFTLIATALFYLH